MFIIAALIWFYAPAYLLRFGVTSLWL